MPSREEMIDFLQKSDASLGAKAGQVQSKAPSRDEMIKFLQESDAAQPSVGGQLADATGTTLRSMVEGPTLGLSEPIISGYRAGVNQLYRAASQSDIGQLAPSKIGEAYDEDVASRRALKERYPISDIGGSIAGAFAPIGPANMIAKEVSALGRGASEATKATEIGQKLSNPVTKALGDVARSGAEGALTSLATEKPRQAIEKLSGHMNQDEGASAGDLLEGGAKWGAGLAALPHAFKAAKYLGKIGMSATLGPKVETIDKYLANSKAINAAPTVGQIKDEIDLTVRMLADDVASGKIKHEEAKGVLNALEAEHRDIRSGARDTLQQARFDASDEFQRAQANLDRQVANETQKLGATRPPFDLAPDIVAAQSDLRRQVSKGSGEAYDILGKQNGTVDFRNVWKGLKNAEDSMNIAGVAPATPQAKAAQAEIRNLRETLGALPSELSPSDAKQVIQQIDRAEKVIYDGGQFTDDVGRAFKDMRKGLDTQLKQYPEYADKMKSVAEKTALLGRASERFPDQQAALSKLRSIGSETAGPDRQLLDELGKHTGQNLTRDIDDFMAAQKILKDPARMEELLRGMPGYDDMALAKMQVDHLKNPANQDSFIDQIVSKSGIRPKLDNASSAVETAESQMNQAKQKLEPFRGLTPETTEAKIYRLARAGDNPNKEIELQKTIEDLQGQFGSNWKQDIANRGTLDQFSKSDMNGSRKVTAGGALGSFIGYLMGGVFGASTGAAAGGATGLLADKYGPAAAKKILDAIVTIKGTPTAQSIKVLNLPPDVADFVSAQLVRHQLETVQRGRAASSDTKQDSKQTSFTQPGNVLEDKVGQAAFRQGN